MICVVQVIEMERKKQKQNKAKQNKTRHPYSMGRMTDCSSTVSQFDFFSEGLN